MPQNIITAIHQTPEGYLWVATLDGLARFDGVRFTVFNKTNTNGISSNRFSCLYQGPQGDLWAGTEVGVITRHHQGQFTTYTTKHGLPGSPMSALTGDPQGRVWALCGNKVYEWEPATGRFTGRDTPPFSGGAGNLGWKAGGGFWGFDQTSLHLFVSGDWTQVALPAELGGQLSRVSLAEDGSIWIMAVDARMFRLKGGKLTAFPPRNTRPRALRPMTEWRDRAGTPWEMEVVETLFRKLTIPSSGQTETITLSKIFEDREGNLWLGTDGQGLYRIRKQIVAAYSKEQGLIGRNVYPVYEDRAGVIWVGGWDGGLSQIKAGKITNLTTSQGLSAGPVTAFCEDRTGRLWIATHTGVQTFEQGRFTPSKAQYAPGQSGINFIFQDRMGAMWFGTDQGLFRYHNGHEQYFTVREGAPGEVMRSIIDAAEGGVWVGCYGGLMRWRDGKITTWTEQNGLPGNAVRALYEDQDGALWIGTYDSGLGRFKDGKFTRYTTRDGLFNDGAFQILEDAYGYLWMSSNRGIYRVRKQELNEFAAGVRHDITSIAFGKNDGMRNVECNGGLWPAGVRSRDGLMWFPTQDGVAVIDPASVTTNQQPPPVLIEAVLQDREPIPFRDEVRLRPGQGNLEIQYTALSFANAAFSRFKYKLEGLDGDWVDAGTRRAAFFSYLPPGDYTFKVIAANSDGVWNTEGISLRVTALPPFYRTWWFLTLASLSVAGIFFAAYKYRVTQLERKNVEQQAFSRLLITSQERERQRLAAELHDGLSQNLVIIKNRAMISLQRREDAEEAFEQVAEIAEAADHALFEVREIAHNLRPFLIDRLGLTKAIEAVVRKGNAGPLRFSAKLDKIDSLLPPESEINLYRIIQEGVNNIVKHSQATEAGVTIKRRDQTIEVVIQDNGRGFTPGATQLGQSRNGSGLGLAGINERARILGCRPVIESAPGRGAKISLTITAVE